MSDSASAVRLLIDEAWAAHREGRYARAVDAGARAVLAAERLDDAALLARALVAEASPLRMLGDHAAALVRYTRVLGMANDPALADRLAGPQTAEAVCRAYLNWVESARSLTGIGWRELFGVLDAAERWLAATGHRDWRGGVLLQRAILHRRLGQWEAAVAAGQEALAIYNPNAPGYDLAGYRFQVGDILRDADRHDEARPQYQAILDDPDAGAYGRMAAYEGLARCALAGGDAHTARRHATAAMRLAEPLGDNALCMALGVLVATCRAAPDLDAAWQAAARHMEVASRIGDHVRPYFGVRDAVDVALDRADVDTARRLLTDLDTHATALDATAGTTTYTAETAELRRRLTELETGAGAP